MMIRYFIFLQWLAFLLPAAGSAQPAAAGRQPVKSNLHIAVRTERPVPGDTLFLLYYPSILLPELYEVADFVTVTSVAGPANDYAFDLDIDSSTTRYFCLATKNRKGIFLYDKVSPFFHFEPGDSIKMTIRQGPQRSLTDVSRNLRFSFSGRGSGKYRTRYLADSAAYFCTAGGPVVDAGGRYNPDNSERKKMQAALELATSGKQEMSSVAWQLLKTDIVYSIRSNELQLLRSYLSRNHHLLDQQARALLLTSFLEAEARDAFKPAEEYAAASKDFVPYLLKKEKWEYNVKNDSLSADSVYFLLKRKYSGRIRDKLLAMYFAGLGGSSVEDYNRLLEDALKMVADPVWRAKLAEFKSRATGAPAFGFSLQDDRGRTVSLRDFRNKVVFVDFWFTGCGSCSRFYKEELSGAEAAFESNKNVVFVTICIDTNKETWIKSIGEGKYTSPKAVNLYTGGQGSKHPVIKKYNVVTYPQPMLIDQKQRIFKFNSDDLRKKERIISSIKELL